MVHIVNKKSFIKQLLLVAIILISTNEAFSMDQGNKKSGFSSFFEGWECCRKAPINNYEITINHGPNANIQFKSHTLVSLDSKNSIEDLRSPVLKSLDPTLIALNKAVNDAEKFNFENDNAEIIIANFSKQLDHAFSKDRMLSKDVSAVNDVKAHIHNIRHNLDVMNYSFKCLSEDPKNHDTLEALKSGLDFVHEVVRVLATTPMMDEPVLLTKLIKSATNSLKMEAQKYGVNFECKLNAGLSQARVDSKLKEPVWSVINNLVGNAIRYIGKIGSLVELAVREDEEGFLLFTVRDNGPGIAQDVQKKLFGLGVRGNNDNPGSGIGLWNSKELVEKKILGKIGVDSKFGEGSTFWFTVPLYIETRNLPEEREIKEKIEILRSKLRLLIVDDNPFNISALEKICNSLELKHDSFTSAEAAIKAFCKNPYDLVLTDMNLGADKMQGTDLASKIREHKSGWQVIIALISGNSFSTDELKNFQIDYSIIKPANQKSIEEILSERYNFT